MGIATALIVSLVAILIGWFAKQMQAEQLLQRFRRNVPYPAVKIVPHASRWNDGGTPEIEGQTLIYVLVSVWVTPLVDRPVYLLNAWLRTRRRDWLKRQLGGTQVGLVDEKEPADPLDTVRNAIQEQIRPIVSRPGQAVERMVAARMQFSLIVPAELAKKHEPISRARLIIMDSFGSRYRVKIPAIPWLPRFGQGL